MTFTVKNPKFRELIREKLEKQYFMHHIGMELDTIEAGRVEGSLDFTDELKQQNGFLHGGVTATLCDVVAGFAAFTLVNEDETVVTADLRVSYLNPGDASRYEAKGWVIKTGSMLHFCESEVWGIYVDGSRKLLAKSSSTMATVKFANIEAKR